MLQLLHLESLVHFAGLQNPWHPGSWRAIMGFFSMRLAASLVLNMRNGLTGLRKETIHVAFPVWVLVPCLEHLQLIGISPVCAVASSTASSWVTLIIPSIRIS